MCKQVQPNMLYNMYQNLINLKNKPSSMIQINKCTLFDVAQILRQLDFLTSSIRIMARFFTGLCFVIIIIFSFAFYEF